MDIDQQLISQFGRKRNFKVPEGYFDHLHDSIMEQIPHQAATKPIRNRWFKPKYVAAAACIPALCAVGAALLYLKYSPTPQPATLYTHYEEVIDQQNDAMEQAADYMMIDENDMYAYLADY